MNTDLLSSHPAAALEYWFFKVNAGSVALLVDWIARRPQNENVVRVSIHSPQDRLVAFDKLPLPMMPEQNFLSTQHTLGHVGNISWDLDIECSSARVEPDIFPAKLLRMSDLVLVSAPVARFSGSIRQGSLQADLHHAAGMISHYWGRQLAHEWWWLSANQFDQADTVVECAVFQSSLWGSRIRLPMAYLYLQHGDTRRLIISPPAAAKVTGTPESFEIQFRSFNAKTITIKAHGRDYGDLGDRIINTLVGDLDIWEGDQRIAQASGTAALERRAGDKAAQK